MKKENQKIISPLNCLCQGTLYQIIGKAHYKDSFLKKTKWVNNKQDKNEKKDRELINNQINNNDISGVNSFYFLKTYLFFIISNIRLI